MAAADLSLPRPIVRDGVRLRTVWQRGVGFAAWALFGAGWGRVFARGVPASLPVRDGLLLVGVMLLIAAATILWIRHNRAIYRRKGPRRAVPPTPGHPEHDRLGRVLRADIAGIRAAREVVITVGVGEKAYESFAERRAARVA